MPAAHRIIGTAGHIDHGKTSLIRALTGIDLDRLPEEKSRGITIALGFIHHPLPSGRVVSFVDVPGHERLVRTMVAGATGLDAVMLCISASEGVMPQTREHLDILQLLGVQQGLVALTMCDLVDEEMRELATMEVEELVEGTFLEGAPIIGTSAQRPASELAPLIAALEALSWSPRESQGPFRLPVDRAFVQRGFGTVVTGTVRSGALEDGAEVHILPDGGRARVRGLQVHGEEVAATRSGLRSALNLAGVERDDLARGMVITDRALQSASILDTRVRLLPGSPDLCDGMRTRILLGTSEVMAVCTVIALELGGTHTTESGVLMGGQSGLVQLRTEAPLVALPGDRFILRRESPIETLGGGEILDPWSRRIRGRDKQGALPLLLQIEQGEAQAHLKRAGIAGVDPVRARIYGVEQVGSLLGSRLLHPDLVSELQQGLLQWLAEWHRDHPLATGCPRRELHSGGLRHLEKRAFEDLIGALEAAGSLVLDGPKVRLPDFEVRLSAAQEDRLRKLEEELRHLGCATPKLDELVQREPEIVPLLMSRGQLIRVGERLVHSEALEKLKRDVRTFFEDNSQMGPTDFKAITGLSRRHAIPLMEWLDTQGVTLRQDNCRVLREA
jgi:selenocysteine-specific elongation factor